MIAQDESHFAGQPIIGVCRTGIIVFLGFKHDKIHDKE